MQYLGSEHGDALEPVKWAQTCALRQPLHYGPPPTRPQAESFGKLTFGNSNAVEVITPPAAQPVVRPEQMAAQRAAVAARIAEADAEADRLMAVAAGRRPVITRHIHRRWHFTKFHTDAGELFICAIKGVLNPVNCMTKLVVGIEFRTSRTYLLGRV